LIKNEPEKITKFDGFKTEVWRLWVVKTEVILKIVYKIPEQQIWKARYEGKTENSYNEHCTHSSENLSWGNNITCNIQGVSRL